MTLSDEFRALGVSSHGASEAGRVPFALHELPADALSRVLEVREGLLLPTGSKGRGRHVRTSVNQHRGSERSWRPGALPPCRSRRSVNNDALPLPAAAAQRGGHTHAPPGVTWPA